MKVSSNFTIQEFVSRETYAKWGARSVQFINPKIIKLAQFYKDFFTFHFKNSKPNITNVKIVINDWAYGGKFNARGYRQPSMYGEGGQFAKTPFSESQHRMGNAFDCNVILVDDKGNEIVVEQSIIHKLIKENWEQFKAAGLTTIEAIEDAPTWLHSDCRTVIDSNNLNIVKA